MRAQTDRQTNLLTKVEADCRSILIGRHGTLLVCSYVYVYDYVYVYVYVYVYIYIILLFFSFFFSPRAMLQTYTCVSVIYVSTYIVRDIQWLVSLTTGNSSQNAVST
jgi:hypothetical protein